MENFIIGFLRESTDETLLITSSFLCTINFNRKERKAPQRSAKNSSTHSLSFTMTIHVIHLFTIPLHLSGSQSPKIFFTVNFAASSAVSCLAHFTREAGLAPGPELLYSA